MDGVSDIQRLSPDTALTDLAWISKPRRAPLARLGLRTVRDLVGHFPRRLEDRRRFDRFPEGEMDRAVCLFATVTRTGVRRFGRRHMFEATIEEDAAGVLSQPLTCRWFNIPYISRLIATGDRIVVFGRPKQKGRQVVIDHPEFETIEEDEDTSIHLNRIVPIHPAGEGVTPRVVRTLIHRALAEVDPAALRGLLGDPLAGALRAIHFPDTREEAEQARTALVREELFGLQILVQSRRSAWRRLAGHARPSSGRLVERLRAALPFSFTASQEIVLDEIRRDLAAPGRMNRLLQGDVGSGKTVVALAALLLAVEAGWSGALMAPTQILAEQHYRTFRRWLDPLGIPIRLRTGARDEGSPVVSPAAPGILIGTHALLYEEEPKERLGLVVIDEQHKFGVLQRARLIDRGDAPDVLVMTATPIPRTLTQTVYGDLDLSIIREKPAHRGNIQTAVRSDEKLPEVVAFLRRQLEKGRQAYVVYALVEESDKLSAKAAREEFEKWKPLIAPWETGLIHGRMSAEEKEAVMARFTSGQIAVLVSTTVIEVGVDVPNASFLVVENAERFGLAQLHQLRGRVGRGSHKSFCILLHAPGSEEAAREKLSVLEHTSDGFVVAEADWRQRGAGDLLGTAQAGLPPLRLADLVRDEAIMHAMAARAAAIFRDDPALDHPEHAAVKDHLARSRTQLATAAG